MKLWIVPSLTQNLILGLDFWRIFALAPDLFDSAIISSSFELCDNVKQSEVMSVKVEKSDLVSDGNKFPLTSSQNSQLEAIIALFPNYEKQGLGRTCLIQHNIDIGTATPIKQRFYPVSPAVEQLMYKEVDRMLALGVIEESSSPWSSPMRLVVKPGKVRLCLDARKVNQVTKKDAYPLPSIEGIFARLPKANLISKLDLKDAYWQIGLTDQSKPLNRFS